MPQAFSHLERRLLLEGIFYHATEKGERDFPSEKRFMYDIFIHGVLAYLGILHIVRLASEKEMWDLYCNGLAEGQRELQPRIRDALDTLLKPEYRSSWQETEFYEHFIGSWGMPGICNNPKSFITCSIIKKLPLRDSLLESLTQEERTDIEGIAFAIREYLRDD